MFFALLFSAFEGGTHFTRQLTAPGFLPLSSALSHQYHFVNESKTWSEAQSYCRTNYTDLATLYDMDDVNTLIQLASPTDSAWIGLYADTQNSWRWSIMNSSFYGPGETAFRNWATGEPNNRGGEMVCVQMDSMGTWNDVSCGDSLQFVCYGTGGSYTLVNLFLTFSAAQTYCRTNFVDLPSIRNLTENDDVLTAASGNAVYIGLFRTRMWSDASESSFRNWGSGQPVSSFDLQCAVVRFSDSGKWTDEECSINPFPFFCYSAYVSSLRVVVDTETELTEAEIEETILKPLREELIQNGLPNSTTLSLRRVYQINP
ncbi:macrophage mannose receptor 1-like isoform X1 [Alosa pseudoharengus]|uniref:macrophage mannose receptor 1-like isoform X1 n=1 Tax=Alosa pseudoharengus TaxID=34774 RepID=UPI003F897443